MPEAEKFRVEYWMLEEMKLRRRPAPKPLTGKVALVTGGGSGIGRAIAHGLRAAGAVVVAIDRNLRRRRQTATEIGSADDADGRRGGCHRRGSGRGAVERGDAPRTAASTS